MKFFSAALLASLSFTAAYIPVPSRDVSQSANANPPSRKDITTMGREEFSLYILAMQQWQKAQPSEIGGYFQVCGIHGAPHQYWDDQGNFQANTRQGNKNGGYCFHGTKDFYLWHRPYIALYEQQLKAIATNIANNWYAPQRDTYKAAAANLRLPYWDWAKSGTVPSQISGSQITIVNATTGQSQQIANPLFSYTTTGSLGGTSVGRNGGRTTYRSSTYIKDMNSQFAGLRRGVALLFNTANVCWNVFATYDSDERASCGSSSINSLEGVHNTVHNTICGTMCNLDASAFDPIFWLHHVNVDRVGALWQALNPNTKQPTTTSSSGNFVWDSGYQRGDSFQYMPFRTANSGSSWWTAGGSYDVRSAGYTYPEIADRPSVATLRTRLNNIYGNGRTQQTTSTSRKLKRDDEILSLEERQASANLITPPSQAALAPFKASLISANGSYSEYSAEVTIGKSVAPGESFNLHLFFGDVDASRIANSDYLDAPNRVGGISVSQASSTNMQNAAQGVVPLTDALLNTLIAGGIKDLKPATVRKYVRAKLVWRLVTASGKDIGGGQARGNGLLIRVRRTVVTPDGGAQAAPIVTAPEALVDTTDNTKAEPLPAGVAASSVPSSSAAAATGTSSASAASSSTSTAETAESTA